MKCIKRDYHGFTPAEALKDVDRLVAQNALECCELELVTGRGVIRAAVTEYLDILKIKWGYKFNNDGCVNVYLYGKEN